MKPTWRDDISKGMRRRFSPEYKEQSVARLSEPGATLGGAAAELGITPTQLKTWRLELEAAGSATAIATQKVAAAELADISSIPMDEGWLYLAAAKDLATMESSAGQCPSG